MDRKPVELVRVPKEEKYYDREEVLGRDAASVFPTEAKMAAIDGAALAGLLGAGNRKFISETELEEIKTKQGLRVEDGTIAPDKPLAEILREAKEAKEMAFQDKWKQMKQGKNRPLDEDELEFVDSLVDAQAAAARRARQEEEDELAAFQAAQRAQQGGGGTAGQEGGEGGAGSIVGLADQQPGAGLGPAAAPAAGRQQAAERRQAAPKKQPLVTIKPVVRPIVRVKSGGDAGSGGGGSEPAAKRPKTGGEQQQHAAAGQQGGGSGGQEEEAEEEEGPGLAGLLGGYGSDDSDS